MVNSAALLRISELLPAIVTKATSGFGSFINIFLHAKNDKEFRGWIYQCDWILNVDGSDVAHSADMSKQNFNSIFFGKKLEAVFENIDKNVILKFSTGTTLTLIARPDLYGQDDLIIFFFGDGETVSYKPTVGFYREFEQPL